MDEHSNGRRSRAARLTGSNGGLWSSASQDFVGLATRLYLLSKEYTEKYASNHSAYALAGIPMLFSALRAFLIECNSGIYGGEEDRRTLSLLARSANEIAIVADVYKFSTDLVADLGLLYEIRNEILHPAHRPSGAIDSTPEYIRSFKQRGLLHTMGAGPAFGDYVWTDQIQSHHLFRFAFEKVEDSVEAICNDHTARAQGFNAFTSAGFRMYRSVADVERSS